MRGCVGLVLLAACGNHDAAPEQAAQVATAGVAAPAWACDPLPFAASTPVPEASGAAWITFRGKPALFVISDSGNAGAYGIVDPESGDTIAQGKLPGGPHGDDFEGVAARGGKLYALLSNGFYVELTQDGETFTEVPPVSLGAGMTCKDDPRPGNCGKNFEGICLDDTAQQDACVGFAASKADGKMYCLVDHDGALAADPARTIAVSGKNVIADCAIDEHGTLWVGANIFELGQVYRVDGWRDPAHAKVVALGRIGPGNPEVLAVRGDLVYRMSDTNGTPSLMAKFRCAANAR